MLQDGYDERQFKFFLWHGLRQHHQWTCPNQFELPRDSVNRHLQNNLKNSQFPNNFFHSTELKSGKSSTLLDTVLNQSSHTTWYCAVINPVSVFSIKGTQLACSFEIPRCTPRLERGVHLGIFLPSAIVFFRT